MMNDMTRGPGLFGRLLGAAPSLGDKFVRGVVVMACSMHPTEQGIAGLAWAGNGARSKSADNPLGDTDPGHAFDSAIIPHPAGMPARCHTAALSGHGPAPRTLLSGGGGQAASIDADGDAGRHPGFAAWRFEQDEGAWT
ncbi:hypothetical protein BV97_01131 [Novosphingobium resinovorum]|uniref:Uncharacterized protein n=1 Tax=Novosphingobium resinovorum TaxID=158500 RepID=A0A031K4J9_9SPHN|nr:hypothetical protein BV97_01131 [Novosphingobium resinovorum]